jgi:hypothetical protein
LYAHSEFLSKELSVLLSEREKEVLDLIVDRSQLAQNVFNVILDMLSDGLGDVPLPSFLLRLFNDLYLPSFLNLFQESYILWIERGDILLETICL